MLIIALLAIICGCETWEEIRDYGVTKEEWLRTFLTLPHGIPCEATFRRLMERIKPKSLEKVYRKWVTPYVGSCLRKQICVDGKTVCGVHRRSDEMLHMVSAWVREDGISLGQVRVEGKSNEIKAIPELLEVLDISGGTVTADAMACQKEIAKTIIENEANYVLAVKLNQPTLYEEINEYFAWAREDPIEKKKLDVYQATSFDHGRTVHWETFVTADIVWFEGKNDWHSLRSFILVERTRSVKGRISTELAFYISSLDTDAKHCHQLVRGHWSVENQLHWMLDVAFHEDACAAHTGNAPQNLSLLRKMALTCIRKDTSIKASVSRKQKIAGWDNDFALRLLQDA